MPGLFSFLMPRCPDAPMPSTKMPPVATARTITRRAALAGMAAAGAVGALWPYTPRFRRSVPRGRIELTYWEKWTGREGLALQQVIDDFNASQSRSFVHLVPIGDIDAKAMVAIGGGDPPDLVGLYSYNVPGYAEARAVLPLDTFPAADRLAADAYLPGVRNLLWHEGRQWAGVNTCYTLALYYNKSLFRAADLDPQSPPRTISALDEAAQRLTTFDSQRRITQAGFLQNLPWWWPYLWPFLFGGSLYDESSAAATIDSPAGIASFEWLRASAARYGVAATRAYAAGYGRSMHSANDPFISAASAMIVQGPWLGNFIASLAPTLDYGVAPLPVADNLVDDSAPIGLLECDVLMIPRGCPHPQEAFDFLLYHQSQPVQERLAAAHFKPSPLARVSKNFMSTHPHPGIAAHEAIARSPRARVLPRTRTWKQYSDLTMSAFDAVWAGADPAVTLHDVARRAQALIDNAAAIRARRPA